MFSFIREFIKRHKKKIIVVGVVVGGAMLGSRYAQRKFIEWQEKETKEFIERTRKQQYFESTEKTCNQTIIFLSSTLRENIIKEVKCEDIIQSLKENPPNKIELWQELKVLVFTKVTLLVYCGTLLVVALRIQLNIIGGHIYCKTVSNESDSNISNSLQEKYLSLCYHLLNTGIKELLPLFKEKVTVAVKDINLNQGLNLQHLENIFWAIQSSISNDPMNPLNNMSLLLYGNDFQEDDPFIKEMMIDTRELLQSKEVLDIASSCISRGFSVVIDKISEYFLPEMNSVSSFPSTSKDTSVKFPHVNNIAKPLAKIIPIINGFGNPGNKNTVVDAWISPFFYMERVKLLGANVYESYCWPKNGL